MKQIENNYSQENDSGNICFGNDPISRRYYRQFSRLENSLHSTTRVCFISVIINVILVVILAVIAINAINDSRDAENEISSLREETIELAFSLANSNKREEVLIDTVRSLRSEINLLKNNPDYEEDMPYAVYEGPIDDGIYPNMYKYIPLSDDVKQYIYTSAKNADIPPEVMFAMAWKESSFIPSKTSTTNDHGLFQINESNFNWLATDLGYTVEEFRSAVYDPYVNCDAAIIVLTDYSTKYHNDNWHHLLMRYNLGPTGADDHFEKGVYSTQYSREILNYAEDNFGFSNIDLR